MAEQQRSAAPALAPKSIEQLPPGDYHDSGCRGLALRVTPQGTRVFRWRIRSARRMVTIGEWSRNSREGFVTLQEARGLIERLKDAHRAGKLDDELAKLHPAPTPPAPLGSLTVSQEVDAFLVYLQGERREPEQARRAFKHDVLPVLGARPLTSITPDDARSIIEAKAKTAPVMAHTLGQLLDQFGGFAVDRKDIPSNPFKFRNLRVLGAKKAEASQRFLSNEEIPRFLKALDSDKSMTPTVKIGLRLLLLLGVRSGELLQATWDEVDFGAATWTIPVAHQKLTLRQERNARPWTVPLPQQALDLFRQLKGLADGFRSRFVMASIHAGGEALTEKALNHAMRRLFVGEKAALHFEGERPTPHDLRRTVRTHLGDRGIPWHVAESVLHHRLGGTVAATYDRGNGYLKERRAALEEWAEYIERLTAPRESNVAFLPKAGRP